MTDKTSRLLLRGVEYCEECGKAFLSLYPLDKCHKHTELEEV